MTKVMVVDDEEHIVFMLKLNLEGRGFSVLPVYRGRDVLPLAKREFPDIILLDLLMPDMDGREVCRALKADPQTRPIPVIMVTALASTRDKVEGLGDGADDYVTKPFVIDELVARIQANIRQSHRTEDAAKTFGNVTLTATQVLVAGSPVPFTFTEFKILSSLLGHGPGLVDRNELCLAVLGSDDRDAQRQLDVHMANIRRKLAEAGGKGCAIRTVRGKGYVVEA